MTQLAFPVLRILADGEFHSGEIIARRLQVSRSTVWNALQEILAWGIAVHRVPGRGYRLADPWQPLEPGAVDNRLGSAASHFSLEILECAGSTNAVALERAAQGAPTGTVVAAELQTAGRGRRGRPWHSSLGGALTFSVIWRFEGGVASLSGLSLAVALALVRALERMGVAGARLKWPNDVIHRFRKLAGILIELQGDVLGPSAAVIGIGINLKLSAPVVDRIDQPVTDVFSIAGTVPERNQALATILVELLEVLRQFEGTGFAALREEWMARHAYQGQPVRLRLPDGSEQRGTVREVSKEGALVLDAADGSRSFNSGEISLRPGAATGGVGS